MHVKRTEWRKVQDLGRNHISIIDRQDQIRLHRSDPLNPFRRIYGLGRVNGNSLLTSGHGRSFEPDVLVGIILVRDQRDDVISPSQKQIEAGVPYFAISEKN